MKKNSDQKKKEKNMTLAVIDINGQTVGDYTLDSFVFDGDVNEDLIHQAVVAFSANQRKGLASAKTRGEVSGGGKKPWRQKGTGRARVGSTRSPLWKGGGVTIGPRPHSFKKDLPKKMKALAFKSALNVKCMADEILVLDNLELKTHKTKEFLKIIKNLKIGQGKTRFVIEVLGDNDKRASNNIKSVVLTRAADAHATEIVNCKKLVITKGALGIIEGRVKKCLQ